MIEIPLCELITVILPLDWKSFVLIHGIDDEIWVLEQFFEFRIEKDRRDRNQFVPANFRYEMHKYSSAIVVSCRFRALGRLSNLLL